MSTASTLLSRARKRQSQAWEELFELYSPLVAHWCARCGMDAHASADCVQEVFASVARSLDSYEAGRTSGAFRAWLWTITRNKIRDFVRRDRRQAMPSGGSSALVRLNEIPDLDHVPTDEPSSNVELEQLIARGLEQVRAEFEPRTWEIFIRTVVDQIPTALVASEFNIQSASVRQIRSRVLRRLREQLGDIS